MRRVYPSDISRERFEIILPDLESCRKKTKPRKLDLYDVFCGVLYVLKSGCQWRMLPKEFPKWRNCYDYFKKSSEKPNGSKESILERVLKKNSWRSQTKLMVGNSFCIIDAQSVKNADTAEEKGYDAGKKILGIKRHIAVDTQGLPHAIYITTAEITDRSSAVRMVENAKENLSGVKNVLVDAGYTGENFATQIKTIIGATVEVIKRSELHTFVVLPKRWVVERSFAWLEKCRRLWKNCERKLNTSLQMVVLAFTP
ncbi:IS5 family transposase [Wolbachia endosymbiont (group A) of Colletes cunicularius]|uniref:IS5 family transposase n=2 Tax=Wolbachia endosymbiont (group A) of Colletes cunicularius TaxID=3139321 RepID=UPI0035C8F9C4